MQSTKMCRITNSTKHNHTTNQNSRFEKLYDVIYDTLKLIINKNFQNLHNFDDMGTGRNSAKNREIA